MTARERTALGPPPASLAGFPAYAVAAQTAVFRVKKDKATTGRYVDTDYTKCIGCHICADVCPTGYIQMGLGE